MRSRFRIDRVVVSRVTASFLSALCLVGIAAAVWGSELTLKDGTVLRGKVETPVILRGDKEPSIGFIRVDDGLRRVTFYKEMIQSFNEAPPLVSSKPFRIKQRLEQNPNLVVGHIVSIVSISPFDEFGRRIFTAKDARGELAIPQGITEINPEYVKVKALTHVWDSSISTQAVPPAVIESVLRKSIEPTNVDDRLRLVRFFLAAEWFVQAGNELKAIAEEFPNVAGEVREANRLLEEAKARRRLKEIKLRRGAGQHRTAFELLRDFPLDGAPGEVVVEVRDLTKEYDGLVARMDLAQREIEKLSGAIEDAELRSRMAPALAEISKSLLYVEAFGRLDHFLSLLDKADKSPEEKLAAAISGWVAGNAFAEANVDRAMQLWAARAKIAEYLTEPAEMRRQRIVAELKDQETIAVDLAAHVLENLAPWVATPNMEPDKPTKVTIRDDANRDIDYWVVLPPEYNPHRSYPVIITLHGKGVSPETQISWWSSPPGFQAGRHGYIVVAPEYQSDPKSDYEYDASAHHAVLLSLIDVRRRFSVDSDHVFLTGHSMGGDAAWDIGLSHPDLFAGVMPICGAPQKFPEFYWPNGQHTSFYITEGERDGTNPDQITKVMQRMMREYHDVQYVEYKGRGHENFSDEILRLFDWMGRKNRRKFPLSFSCRTARTTDNEFFYVSVDDFAPGALMDPYNFDRRKMKPGQVEGKITGTANSIQLTLSGAKRADLWISPGMVDLAQPITVRVNGQKTTRKMAPLDLQVLLEDFRARADRQKLFYAKMSFPRI